MEATDKKLLPQNFRFGIFLSSLYIIDVFYNLFTKLSGEKMGFYPGLITWITYMIIYACVLLFIRKYLLNFSAGVSVKWINIGIATFLLFNISLMILYCINPPASLINAVILLIILILCLYAMIKFSLSIGAIQDDYIGLLKVLGSFIVISSICYPISMLDFIVKSKIVTVLIYLSDIPTQVVLIIIYIRAIRYTKVRG